MGETSYSWWSKGRLAPLIEDTLCLRDKVKDPRSRDSGNTVQSKEFPGGIVVITGANSAVGLRSMPVRYLFLDEVDAYPPDADSEGDPLTLAIQRTATFARRKIFIVSTPTIKGLSRIEKEFEETEGNVLGEFLSQVALVSDLDETADIDNSVVLMTLHAAKRVRPGFA